MTPENNRVLQAILQMQAGDKLAREDFIREYKPFIAKTTMNLCKRPLDWEQSDELSIAMIAFNSSIDSYNPDKRVPFLPYAKVVIQNRLKDYFRKTSRLQAECSLTTESEDGKIISPAEIQAAWEDHQERTIEDERQEEIAEYEKLLSEYGIDFFVLVEASPKHRDSRQTLLDTAKHITGNPEMMRHLLEKKQLLISELVLHTGINRKTLERGRKFIISTTLVLYFASEFPHIRSFIDI